MVKSQTYSTKVIISALSSILLITFLSFLPSLGHDILHWDDPGNLTNNILVRQLNFKNIYKIFRTPVMAVYVPLTILSFSLEYHFFGFNPFVFHLNNLLLHLGVTVLVFGFLLRLGLDLRVVFFSALIFAIHPTRVESVAWITERKDVLYAFFYMLALNHYLSYLFYHKRKYFALTMLWGLLSILSKPMAWSLPLILLLCDWYINRKFDVKVIWEKAVLVLYMLPIACITLLITLKGSAYTFLEGILLISWSLSFYIQKFLWPVNLLTIYSMPQPVSYINPVINISFLVNSVFLVFVFYFRRNRKIVFGSLFFVGSIFLLLKSHDVPGVNFVADRYMYLPLLGLAIIVSDIMDRWLTIFQRRRRHVLVSYGFLAIVFLFLAVKTFQLTKVWKTDLSLWSYICRLSPENAVAFANRGTAYMQLGQDELALKDFNRALEIDGDHIVAYNNRGVIYLEQRHFEQALKDFNKAISLKPDYAQAFLNRGRLHFRKNDLDQALQDFDKAIMLEPLLIPAHMKRGELFVTLKRYDQALADYQKVLRLDPLNKRAYVMQAHILNATHDNDALVALYTKYLKHFPRSAKAYNARGIAYTIKREHDKAREDFDQALRVDPENAEAYNNRGNIYFRTSQFDMALQDFKEAVAYNPQYLEAYNNLGNMYFIKKEYMKAIENYTQAININGSYPSFYYQRSRASAKLGDFKTALKDAKTARDLGLAGLEKYISGLEHLVALAESGQDVQAVFQSELMK